MELDSGVNAPIKHQEMSNRCKFWNEDRFDVNDLIESFMKFVNNAIANLHQSSSDATDINK